MRPEDLKADGCDAPTVAAVVHLQNRNFHVLSEGQANTLGALARAAREGLGEATTIAKWESVADFLNERAELGTPPRSIPQADGNDGDTAATARAEAAGGAS